MREMWREKGGMVLFYEKEQIQIESKCNFFVYHESFFFN